MASTLYRNRREARDFLCHLWISASCIVLAAIFFGISSINNAFIFVGIFFLVLALLVFSFYFMCRNRQNKNQDCCSVDNNGQCCFYCCDGCIRTIFCLGPRRAQPRSPNSRIALHNAVTQRERAVVSSTGYDNFALARPTSATPHHASPPAYSSGERRAELRSLETEIHELLMDCSRIQERLNGVRDVPTNERSLRRSDRELLNIHDSLSTEFGLLGSWIEGNRDIPLADIERMRSGLQHLQRRLRLLENGVTPRPMPDTGSTSQSQTQPTRESIIGVASLTGPLPPSVHHPTETPRRDTVLPPPYREYDAPQAVGLQAGGFEFMGRLDSEHFRLPYYLVAPTLAPPEDDSGAPPSYEEASSSQV